jgi:hypothetical protein
MKRNMLFSVSLFALLATSFSAMAAKSIKDATCDLAIGSANGVQLRLNNSKSYALDESNFSILQDKGYNPYVLDIPTATEAQINAIKLSLGISASYQKNSGISFCLICFGDRDKGEGKMELQIKKRVSVGGQLSDVVVSEVSSSLNDASFEVIQSAVADAYKKLPDCQKN